ncbi:MAG: hypothetical protein ACTID1_05630 [Pseudolactococcus laudensis]|uniref:Uncharacterized protein n=1 Tax=Pseudolactococcus laudensis TaxID=1494461 RepID=A0A7V8MZ64_9LACT|nr:hypothetical protein [Lactococcus laudensis]MBA0015681.1 hypothetical protein [Lactococcus laudensis]MBW9280584.1 hypothetical protein [Lactococcus laudensis]CCK20761.1 hypothetical protein BN193_11120 [Lactococcus raffinolactis 4877]
MTKKKLFTNKWYILYALVPILFFAGAAVTLQLNPIKNPSILIYGVKSAESDKNNNFKFSKMTLTDGRVIEQPTMDDMRENNLFTYHNEEELNHAYSFTTNMLN